MKLSTRTLQSLLPLVAFVLSPSVYAVCASEPCIAEGETRGVGFDRPALDAPGMPANAEWVGADGAPEAFDVDGWSDSDPLGPATSTNGGASASVTVRNSGGELFGPNGHDVEGGLEGECLEVKIVWKYRYRVLRVSGSARQISVAPEGVGGTWTTTNAEHVWVWRQGTVSQGPKQVCPC